MASNQRIAKEKGTALPDQTQPIQYGGVDQGRYRTQAHFLDPNMHLTGRSFITRTLPDVQPHTKVIGICGIHDWPAPIPEKNDTNPAAENPAFGTPIAGTSVSEPPAWRKKTYDTADPHEDGWFFSDFYLFHHLLMDVAQDQVWLTSFKPEDAVRKYGEYIHGSPAPEHIKDRRVVLDNDMLPYLGDVRVCRPQDLLERSLATIRDARRQAAQERRPMLILIFAHGQREGSGPLSLELGGTSHKVPNLLSTTKFKEALGSTSADSGVSLLTTACFGGEWAINPDLKISTLAAQAEFEETLSWPLSGTLNHRYCGSPFISAIAAALLHLSIDGYGYFEAQELRQTENYSYTYNGFINVVQQTVQSIDSKQTSVGSGQSASVHQPMFSVQDDEWEMEFRKRTGLPLDKYLSRWKQLKIAIPNNPAPPRVNATGRAKRTSQSSASATSQSTSEPPFEGAPGERSFNMNQAHELLRRQAQLYFNCNPGIDSAKNQSLHDMLREVINGHRFSPGYVRLLQETLDYRMYQIMHSATLYKRFLDIKAPDCEEVFIRSLPGFGTADFGQAFTLVRQHHLFDPTPDNVRFEYLKGEEYLAWCILQSGWSREQAVQKLDSLVRYRHMDSLASGVTNVLGTSRILHHIVRYDLDLVPGIQKGVQQLAETVKKTLRARRSPRKFRQRRTDLPQESGA